MEQFADGTRFEVDYLERTYGGIIRNPLTALTEVVANAWDAAATEVRIVIPEQQGGELTITDNGSGMTATEFNERWMTLGYNRFKHQGEDVEFPGELRGHRRKAFGRNGIGRHGLFCFGNEYEVETRKVGKLFQARVVKDAGKDPFALADHKEGKGDGHGTLLRVRVQRNFPDAGEVRDVLSSRFISDPLFKLYVNDVHVPATENEAFIDRKIVKVGSVTLDLMTFDSGASARTAQQSGVAFWVRQRLVGKPTWSLGDDRPLLDGRLKPAKRLVIVARTDDLADLVLPDWSGFQESQTIEKVYDAVAEYARDILRGRLAERVKETTASVISNNRERLEAMEPEEREEISEFVEQVTLVDPAIPPELLQTALGAFMNLMETRSGRDLISKLSQMSHEDVDGLNAILEQWSVQDCRTVLDEIHRRMRVIELIEKLSADPTIDELHTLHPLVTQARWLFGPEFDTPEMASNMSIRRALGQVCQKQFPAEAFVNPSKRPDLLQAADRTLSAYATEMMSGDGTLSRIDRILLIELKKGASEIGRKEMDQAGWYVEDIHGTGLIDGKPLVLAFVVGHTVSSMVQAERAIGEPVVGRIRACSYGQLVRTANARLFKLRTQVQERFKGLSKQSLVDEVLRQPQQGDFLKGTPFKKA